MTDEDVVYRSSTDLREPAAFPARLASIIGNMSVRAFARNAGVSDTFLRQCLAGRTEPTRTKLLAIAQAGGVRVEWLAAGGEPATGSQWVSESAEPDTALLETTIAVVEQVLQASDERITPQCKARLITALYRMRAAGERDAVSREDVERLIADAG